MINWYLQNGKDSDVVISSRIRLARNLADFPFKEKAKTKDLEQVLKTIKEITPSIGYNIKYIELKNIDDVTKISLIEKHLISPEFASNENGAILINEEENICIMINEEDHIRIQVFASGQELENLLNLAIELDEKIDGLVKYAVNKKYGYLTSCPTNVGTGLRASVMVHLPALTLTGNISKVLNVINNFGMNIRGMYGENNQVQGDIYQISNKQTLGITEQEIVQNVKVIVQKIIEQERQARKLLAKDELDLEDIIYRSYGILTNCRKISYEEARNLLSNIKLGTDLGILRELTDLKVQKLYLYIKPANLQKYLGEQYEAIERDIKRAEVIKQIITEK